MNLQGLFQAISKQMESELEAIRYAITHAGLKGAASEDAVRQFLRRYFPQNLAIETGILIDSHGRHSRQLDIIIYDRAKTPSLFFAGGSRVIPIECAYAVIEVKTKLTMETLDSCFQNMASSKTLTRSAYYPEGMIVTPSIMYGQEFSHWQLQYYVFAYESPHPLNIVQRMKAYAEANAVNLRIDAIFTLDHGLIANLCDERIDALPTANSKLVSIKKDALLVFYTILSHYLNQAYIQKFRFSDYIKTMPINVEIFGTDR